MAKKYAPTVYDALNGVFCIYKPEGRSFRQVMRAIQEKLTQELNSMEVRPPRRLVKFNEDHTQSDVDLPVVTTVPDLADHPLVVGPRYQVEDFSLNGIDILAWKASGIQLMSIGHGGSRMFALRDAKPVRVYHVSGELGRATNDFDSDRPLVEKTTYGHVTQAKVDRTLAAMQGANRKAMFLSSGIDLQTQEAYDLAASGLIRPKDSWVQTDGQGGKGPGPVIYGLKCIEFDPPHFTLEVHCVHEKNSFLMRIIHELGLTARSSAVCTKVRRIRYGHFQLEHALLRQDWDHMSIIENIAMCKQLLTPHKLLHKETVKQTLLEAQAEEKRELELQEQRLLQESFQEEGERRLSDS